MFPLNQRRKFARIINPDIIAEIIIDDKREEGIIKDLSANGCKLVSSNDINIPLNKDLCVKFKYNDKEYEFNAVKVRENAYKFSLKDKKALASLNSAILTDYFNDEPELRKIILSED